MLCFEGDGEVFVTIREKIWTHYVVLILQGRKKKGGHEEGGRRSTVLI